MGVADFEGDATMQSIYSVRMGTSQSANVFDFAGNVDRRRGYIVHIPLFSTGNTYSLPSSGVTSVSMTFTPTSQPQGPKSSVCAAAVSSAEWGTHSCIHPQIFPDFLTSPFQRCFNRARSIRKTPSTSSRCLPAAAFSRQSNPPHRKKLCHFRACFCNPAPHVLEHLSAIALPRYPLRCRHSVHRGFSAPYEFFRCRIDNAKCAYRSPRFPRV